MTSFDNEERAAAASIHLAASSGRPEHPSATAVVQPQRVTMHSVRVYERLLARNMLVPGSNLGPEIKDQYRRIKRPLISNAFGKSSSLVDNGNLIVVTSSVPDEGKTYTAVNLALAISQERDNTVLLLDGDITKQGVSRTFGLENRPGITNIIENENFKVEQALVRTDIPNLVVLPAGVYNEYVTELLASKKMQGLIEEIANRYEDRIIIIDAPPMLATPMAQVLTTLAGQIVFVIEAGRTPQSVVQDAVELLPQEKPVGLILNKSVSLSNKGGYYYGYYAPYGDESTE